jgi:hypothetical protein
MNTVGRIIPAPCFRAGAWPPSAKGHHPDWDVEEFNRINKIVVGAPLPTVWIVYGGVFPTYHWREILPWRFRPAFGQDGALLAGNRCLYRERKP